MELDRVLQILRALKDEGVDYVLVGGVAMNLHGIVRATEDVDLFLRVEEENIERLRRALRQIWNDSAIDEVSQSDLAGEYPVIRYGPPDEDFVIDLMSRIGEAFTFDDLEVTTVEVDGVSIRIATPDTLYRMKRGSIRPIDQADAWALRDKFDLADD